LPVSQFTVFEFVSRAALHAMHGGFRKTAKMDIRVRGGEELKPWGDGERFRGSAKTRNEKGGFTDPTIKTLFDQ
jgi:hypothetical protein